MNILIVGAKGMLGTMLMDVFSDLKPTGWDREEIDITNEAQVRENVLALHPDIIINAAAYTNVDEAESKRDMAFLVNETGPRNLAAVAKEIGATLIHYSTDYVFPGTKQEGYTEDEVPGSPVNVYGESKLAGERAVQESGANFYLLRTAWLYGPHGKNFVDTILAFARNKSEIPVVTDQHGSPTFTKDVALATQQLVEEKKPFGVYHAVCQGQATWFDLAKEIFALAHVPVIVTPITSDKFPRPAKRPIYSALQNMKGLHMRDWKTALQDYLTNYRVEGK